MGKESGDETTTRAVVGEGGEGWGTFSGHEGDMCVPSGKGGVEPGTLFYRRGRLDSLV